MTRSELVAVERALFVAWRPPSTTMVAGWIVRSERGGYGRLNSVWPGHFDGAVPVEAAIDAVEAIYCERGRPASFQMIEVAEPLGLDAALDRRGYTIRAPGPSHMLTKPVSREAQLPADTIISGTPSAGYVEFYLAEQAPERAAEFHALIAHLHTPNACITCRAHGRDVSGALAFAVGDTVVVECVATRPDCRGEGAVGRVLAGIEVWAAGQGADRLALQVAADNAPALAAYGHAGFERASGYHYRVQTG